MSPAIEDLVNELEQLRGRIDAIRSEQPFGAPVTESGGSGDSFSPDFGQVIAPDGSVTYDVQAHLKALGLDLDVGDTATPPADRRVRWLRPDGTPVGTIVSNDFGTNDTLGLEVTNPDVPARAAQLYVAAGRAANNVSRIIAQLADSDSAVNDFTILDSDGASGFLQLLTTAKRRIAFGHTGAIFVNGGSITNTVNVAHGLGVAPTWVGVVPWAEDSGFWMPVYGLGGWTSSFFQVFANDVRGLGHGPGNLSGTTWAAIG